MNLVITISRRFGTGASLIAQELSEKLGVPVYDKAYIEHELDDDSYATEAEVIKGLAGRAGHHFACGAGSCHPQGDPYQRRF